MRSFKYRLWGQRFPLNHCLGIHPSCALQTSVSKLSLSPRGAIKGSNCICVAPWALISSGLSPNGNILVINPSCEPLTRPVCKPSSSRKPMSELEMGGLQQTGYWISTFYGPWVDSSWNTFAFFLVLPLTLVHFAVQLRFYKRGALLQSLFFYQRVKMRIFLFSILVFMPLVKSPFVCKNKLLQHNV